MCWAFHALWSPFPTGGKKDAPPFVAHTTMQGYSNADADPKCYHSRFRADFVQIFLGTKKGGAIIGCPLLRLRACLVPCPWIRS